MKAMDKQPAPKIAILGWGSLIWDKRPEFDDKHGEWKDDGPELPLEFSRISETRLGALTLVIDPDHGQTCTVQHALSTRMNPEDAIADLRCREGTMMKRMGFYFAGGSRTCEPPVPHSIPAWAKAKELDAVVWTGLPSNFEDVLRKQKLKEELTTFSVKNAIAHIQRLNPEAKAMAATYVWRAPAYVDTPLRRALQAAPWFASPEPE
jgi:hypothetical protein